jgi:hypothetical protein
MKDEKPAIQVVIDPQGLVLGTKQRPPFLETPDARYLQSIAAYEADE